MKWIWIIPLLLISAFGGPGNIKTNVTLQADYPTNAVSTDLSFNLYSSTNAALPLSSWSVLTNVTYPGCMVNGTNVQVTVPIQPGNMFFYMTASNWFGESNPSNVTNTSVVVTGNNLRIK